MSEQYWMERLAQETTNLYGVLRPTTVLFFVTLFVLSVLSGRLVRRATYVLWRLGLDQEKRLAPIGTLAQVFFCSATLAWVFGILIVEAPVATFLLQLAATPLLVLLLQRPARNAIAGLSILFRRSLLEGDHIVLDGGQRGVVRQIRLTTTVARTDGGGRLLIPNGRLLEAVLEVDRRQAGVPLVLRFSVEGRPAENVLDEVRRLALLSPFRAGGSVVSVDYLERAREVEVGLRLPRSNAQNAARRELWVKMSQVLGAKNTPGQTENP